MYSYGSLSGVVGVVDDELVAVESPSNMLGRCAAASTAWSDLVFVPFLKYDDDVSPPMHNSISMTPQRKNRLQLCWRFILSSLLILCMMCARTNRPQVF